MNPSRIITSRRAIALLGPLLLVVGLAVPPVVAGAAAGTVRGTPWVGAMGVRRTTAQIMVVQRRLAAAIGPQVIPRPEPPDRRHLPQNPASPASAGEIVPAPRTMAAGSARIGLSAGTNFLGATLAQTGAFPPDSMGAVGPTQFLVGVNGRIKVFSKSGTVGALNASMDTFFSIVRNGSSTTDPRVRYDRLTQKWFVTIINVDQPNRVLLAVSDGPTITGATVWTFFYFEQDLVSPTGDGTCLADYPTLGLDANALYIGVNQFCGAQQTFSNSAAFVVRKTSITGAGPIVVTAFRDLIGISGGAYTPQGVNNPDAASTTGYLIGVDNYAFGKLDLRRISDPGGTPTISSDIGITVNSTAYPITVPHKGNTSGPAGRLDAVDDRLMYAGMQNGELWTAHNIGLNASGVASGSPTRDGVRWYRIGSLDGTPAVLSSGTVFDGAASNPLFYWMPGIAVSGQGHAVIGMSLAGAGAYADAAWTGRMAGGSFGAPVAYTSASAAYNPPGDPGAPGLGRRWGDYSMTSVDPCDDMTMWTIQEYTNASNSYGVRVLQVKAPPPATPSSVSSPVVQGQASTTVTLTGASSGGSGFFDPGGSFGCHLSASVTGGVAVSSATYLDATHVTLDLDTTAASTGLQDVTITNPDGQSVTRNNVLSVAPAPSGTANLSISVTATKSPARVGDDLPYTVTVTNAGPDQAVGTTLTDTMPAGARFASATSGTPGVACAKAAGAVSCSLGTIASGDSVAVKIMVSPTVAGTTTNSAMVSSLTSDTDGSDNSGSDSRSATGPTCTIVGTMAADSLHGTSGGDVICGLRGNDTIEGKKGNDTLVGGPGSDREIGGNGTDVLLGLSGNDRLDSRDGASGNDTSSGGQGADSCPADPGDRRYSC